MEELGRVRGIGSNARGQIGLELLQSIRASENVPLSNCPPIDSAEVEANENTLILLRALLNFTRQRR